LKKKQHKIMSPGEPSRRSNAWLHPIARQSSIANRKSPNPMRLLESVTDANHRAVAGDASAGLPPGEFADALAFFMAAI
jgi:hypothetical protein